MAHSCVGLFCEDIREEASGSHTIVGVMPDNITLARPGGAASSDALLFPKMGIYLKLNLDVGARPTGRITTGVSFPGMSEIALGAFEPEALETAFASAIESGLPVVGVIFKAVLSPLQFRESGLATAYVTLEGQKLVGAVLNIQIAR